MLDEAITHEFKTGKSLPKVQPQILRERKNISLSRTYLLKVTLKKSHVQLAILSFSTNACFAHRLPANKCFMNFMDLLAVGVTSFPRCFATKIKS